LKERGRRIEGRKKSEVGGQRTDDRRQTTEDSEETLEVGGKETEIRCQRAEDSRTTRRDGETGTRKIDDGG
jgi:hypothetical protein